MTEVTSIDTILDINKRIKDLRKGFLTNLFLDVRRTSLWIKLNMLFHETAGDTAFLTRKNEGFSNLFYISTNISALEADVKLFCSAHPGETFVIDIIGKLNDNHDIKRVFEKHGFFHYISLMRMSKISDMTLPDTDAKYLKYAGQTEAFEVSNLLHQYFDPYAEQLPLMEEIESWITENRILIYSDDNQTIQGFLIFELLGQTSYLRYWFVNPHHREKKIGSALLRRFFGESFGAKRQLFWVIDSNENAIKRYEHYGFKKEGLIDDILINKNIHYGG